MSADYVIEPSPDFDEPRAILRQLSTGCVIATGSLEAIEAAARLFNKADYSFSEDEL